VHASAIRLTTWWLVAVLVVLAVGLLILVPWRWDAWQRRRTGRAVSTVAAVLAVVLACGSLVNMWGSFFPTLGTVIGSSASPSEGAQIEAGPDGQFLPSTGVLSAARAVTGRGTTVHLTVGGEQSRVHRDVDVYLPAAYSAPDMANARFPVIEWFPGFPGEPREMAELFGLPAALDLAIAAHRMPPTVVIIPDISGEPRLVQDQECVDSVGGVQDDTFLSADLRQWALRALRVRSGRGSWALAGWSTGGYCALDLALRHPQWYSVAASQSGYDHTARDVTTGDLFSGRDDVRAANDIDVLLSVHPAPTAVLLAGGADETDEQAGIARMQAAAMPPTQIDTVTFPGGGHNDAAVRAQLPAILDWVGQQLPPPLDPAEYGQTSHWAGPGVLPWALPATTAGPQ
jgi:S-formylglutathione hydrolase FrmB